VLIQQLVYEAATRALLIVILLHTSIAKAGLGNKL